MKPVRPLPRWFALFTILILGAGCGTDRREDRTEGEVEGPRSGGTAVVAEVADMTTPLALLAQGALDGTLGADILYMQLLRGDWTEGRLVMQTAEQSPMAIARSYHLTGADSASLRLHLRSDVRWSDGRPLTARDVVFTYGVVGDPALASPLQSYVERIRSVEAEDDSTVVFHFARRNPEMLTDAALPILPEHIFGSIPPSEIRNHPSVREPEGGNLVVSGPFLVSSWTRGQQIVLGRNPEFEPAARLDQLVFRIIPDPMTQLVELQTGGVDMMLRVTLDQLPGLLERAPHLRIEREEKRFYDFVGYNGEGFEPFSDPQVRRALGLASDRQAIIDALQMSEHAVAAGGPYAPIFTDLYDSEGQGPLPHDPAEASRILASKGWRDSDGDGVLDKEGVPFRFDLVTNVGNQRRADAAQILQQQWSQIGVDAQIQTVEFNTLNQNLVQGNFEAVLYGWAVALTPDLAPIWGADSPFNFTRYRDPEVGQLIARAAQQPTYEASIPLWQQAASQIVEDQPYTWLYYLDSVNALSERLQGVEIDTYGAYQNTWEWWVRS